MTARIDLRARPPVLLILVMLFGGAACSASLNSGAATPARHPAGVAAPPVLAEFSEALAELAARLRPGLVSVQARRVPAVNVEGSAAARPDESRVGRGSGFVIDARGTIVTAAHVVDGADSISVRLADGRQFGATLIGKDLRADLGVLSIEGAAGLVALAFGDSDRIRVGEFVLALGHPFGLEQSVSLGIISRKGPVAMRGFPPGVDLIQTDAIVNPGNSGGPLVSLRGEVVGITSTAARTGTLGFAIPANLARILVPHLLQEGRMDWGWLGVRMAGVADDVVERLKLPETRGVLIRSVVPGEPAAAAGLRADDVIVAVDHARMDTPVDLQRVISFAAGKRIEISVYRNGKRMRFTVTVGRCVGVPQDATLPVTEA